jgi:hypothetical protein
MLPKSIREGVVVALEGEDLVVTIERSGTSCRLAALTAFVYQHADGVRDVTALTADASAALGLEVSAATVWSALDRLADAGLLEGRVAPPGGEALDELDVAAPVTRRGLLRRVGVLGAAATAGGLGMAQPAAAHDGGAPAEQAMKECRSKQRESQQEIRRLRQQLKGAVQAEADCKAGGNTEESQKESTSKESQSKEQQSKGNTEESQKESQSKESQSKNSEESQKESSSKESQSKESQSKESQQKGGSSDPIGSDPVGSTSDPATSDEVIIGGSTAGGPMSSLLRRLGL